jgi:hypothetical protein
MWSNFKWFWFEILMGNTFVWYPQLLVQSMLQGGLNEPEPWVPCVQHSPESPCTQTAFRSQRPIETHLLHLWSASEWAQSPSHAAQWSRVWLQCECSSLWLKFLSYKVSLCSHWKRWLLSMMVGLYVLVRSRYSHWMRPKRSTSCDSTELGILFFFFGGSHSALWVCYFALFLSSKETLEIHILTFNVLLSYCLCEISGRFGECRLELSLHHYSRCIPFKIVVVEMRKNHRPVEFGVLLYKFRNCII